MTDRRGGRRKQPPRKEQPRVDRTQISLEVDVKPHPFGGMVATCKDYPRLKVRGKTMQEIQDKLRVAVVDLAAKDEL